MAINFPNNPAVNDTFTVGGTKFTFTGVKWETSAVVDLSSDTTPTLGGDLDGGANNINNVGIITATSFTGPLTGTASTASTLAAGATGADLTLSGNLTVNGTTTTIDTAVTEVDSLQVDGNVGIGTTNATEILHVQTGTSDEITTFKVKTGGRVELSRNHASAPYIKTLMDSGNPNIILGDSAGDKVLINGDGSSYFNAGNVGINSTIPTSQLDVNGNITSSGTVTTGGISTTAAGGQGSTITGDGRLTLQFPSGGGGGVGMFSVYSGTSKNIEFLSGGSATFAGTISDSMGPLRRLGINNHNAATYTLVASDAGKLIREATNSANITIPQNVFSAGDMITIFNVSGGNNTITSGAGITLYNTADGATGNRTLAAKGVCTIACTSTNEFIISGSGLS